jgi:hypothetical protein
VLSGCRCLELAYSALPSRDLHLLLRQCGTQCFLLKAKYWVTKTSEAQLCPREPQCSKLSSYLYSEVSFQDPLSPPVPFSVGMPNIPICSSFVCFHISPQGCQLFFSEMNPLLWTSSPGCLDLATVSTMIQPKLVFHSAPICSHQAFGALSKWDFLLFIKHALPIPVSMP